MCFREHSALVVCVIIHVPEFSETFVFPLPPFVAGPFLLGGNDAFVIELEIWSMNSVHQRMAAEYLGYAPRTEAYL